MSEKEKDEERDTINRSLSRFRTETNRRLVLNVLSYTSSYTSAAAAVGMSSSALKSWRRDDQEFDEACKKAKEAASIMAGAALHDKVKDGDIRAITFTLEHTGRAFRRGAALDDEDEYEFPEKIESFDQCRAELTKIGRAAHSGLLTEAQVAMYTRIIHATMDSIKVENDLFGTHEDSDKMAADFMEALERMESISAPDPEDGEVPDKETLIEKSSLPEIENDSEFIEDEPEDYDD